MPKKQPTYNELKQEAINRLLALADAMTDIPIPPVLGHYLSLEKVYEQAGFNPGFPDGHHQARNLLDQFFPLADTQVIIQRVCLPFIRLRKWELGLSMRQTGRSYLQWSDLVAAAENDQDEEAFMVRCEQDHANMVEEFKDVGLDLRSWVGTIRAASKPAPPAPEESKPYDLTGAKDICKAAGGISERTLRTYKARKDDPLPVYQIRGCKHLKAHKTEITAWQTRNKL